MHFLHFYKILTFLVVTGVKGQKKAQNNIKFCPLHSMSQEPCIKWLSFMVHIYKMIISSGVFFFFFLIQNFDFLALQVGKRAKTVQNDKKFCLSHSISQKPYIIWLPFMMQMYKMIISPGGFFNFSKFWFFFYIKHLHACANIKFTITSHVSTMICLGIRK